MPDVLSAFLVIVYTALQIPNETEDRSRLEKVWLERLIQLHSEISPQHSYFATHCIVLSLSDLDRHEEAHQFATKNIPLEERDPTYLSLAVEQAKENKLTEALSTIKKIDNEEFQLAARRHVAMKMANLERFDEAERLLQSVNDQAYRDSIVSTICVQMARSGQTEQALLRTADIQDPETKQETTHEIERIRHGKTLPIDLLKDPLKYYVKQLVFLREDEGDDLIIAVAAANKAPSREILDRFDEEFKKITSHDMNFILSEALLVLAFYVERDDKERANILANAIMEELDKSSTPYPYSLAEGLTYFLFCKLERFELVDRLLKKGKEAAEQNTTSTGYLSTLFLSGEAMGKSKQFTRIETLLERLRTADEKLYFLSGALTGIDVD